MSNLNFERDVRINENALEQELLEQAELAYRYGKEYAYLKKKVAMLDEQVKVTRSKLINKAWGDQSVLTGGKANLQTVEAYYRTNKKYIKVKEEWIEAQYELDLAEIAKNEIGFTKKSSMENLVKLFIAAYFAGPNVPKDISKSRKEREKERKEADEKMQPYLRKDKKDKKKKKDK